MREGAFPALPLPLPLFLDPAFPLPFFLPFPSNGAAEDVGLLEAEGDREGLAVGPSLGTVEVVGYRVGAQEMLGEGDTVGALLPLDALVPPLLPPLPLRRWRMAGEVGLVLGCSVVNASMSSLVAELRPLPEPPLIRPLPPVPLLILVLDVKLTNGEGEGVMEGTLEAISSAERLLPERPDSLPVTKK